mmetsp:Transcript_29400/g.66452  ORF Transcript_29400/g.66452 Transcript_29400/m.66452 type:complete len:214 (+) Transcript_29400:296-937(+)
MQCPRITTLGSTGTIIIRDRMSARQSSTVASNEGPSTLSSRTPLGWRWSNIVRTSVMSKLFTRVSLERKSSGPGLSTPSLESAARMSSELLVSRFWTPPRVWRICFQSTRWSPSEECRLPSIDFSTQRSRRETRERQQSSKKDWWIPRRPPWPSVMAMVSREPSCPRAELRTTLSTFATGDGPRAMKPPSIRTIQRLFSGESTRLRFFSACQA